MTAVKRMTATNAFLNMPFKHRGCNLELFQECKTRRILEKCKCVPTEVQASVGRDPKEYLGCTPEGRDCIQKIKLREDFNCSATCEGIHADVLFETDPLNKMISRGQLDNALEANNGNSKVFKYASKLIKEYRAFKKNMVRSFNFVNCLLVLKRSIMPNVSFSKFQQQKFLNRLSSWSRFILIQQLLTLLKRTRGSSLMRR